MHDAATHVFAISIFSTFFKAPTQYALTPSKTALTTAPTKVIVRCILKLPAHAQCAVAAVAALQVLQAACYSPWSM
jgi:hypothetical protein